MKTNNTAPNAAEIAAYESMIARIKRVQKGAEVDYRAELLTADHAHLSTPST